MLNGDDPKHPKPIPVSRAAELKVLDPACGSGSFLIVAYQYLLDWHRDHYTLDFDAQQKVTKGSPHPAAENPAAPPADGLRDGVRRPLNYNSSLHPLDPNKIKRHGGGKNPKIFQAGPDEYRLTLAERKRILLNNIHGVDIDSQAVEVTKLSLLLKVLEGETDQVKQRDMFKERERILPDLGQNIQCGNSLIGPDFYAQPDLPELDDETRYRINVFDWKAAFPNVFKNGGFDCVIGNPPYLGGREWKESNGRQYDFFIKTFTTADYQFDIYVLFWEQGIRLLRDGGKIGYITPNTWLNNKSTGKLRSFILENTSVDLIGDYSKTQVFPKVTVLPIITVLSRGSRRENSVQIFETLGRNLVFAREIPQEMWNSEEGSIFNISFTQDEVEARNKIESLGVPTEEFAEVKFGIKLYETGKGTPPQTKDAAKDKIFEASTQIDQTYRKYLEGKDINSYLVNWQNRWLKYGPNLAAPRDPKLFEGERLLFRRIVGKRMIGTLVNEGFVTSQLLQIVKPNEGELRAQYVLGILNSRAMAFYFRAKYNRQDKTFPEIRIYELRSLPIRPIDFDNPDDVAKHDRMVTLVDSMLDLHRRRADEKNPDTLRQLDAQITATDSQIDTLVYELYDLTEEEIALVEASAA